MFRGSTLINYAGLPLTPHVELMIARFGMFPVIVERAVLFIGGWVWGVFHTGVSKLPIWGDSKTMHICGSLERFPLNSAVYCSG